MIRKEVPTCCSQPIATLLFAIVVASLTTEGATIAARATLPRGREITSVTSALSAFRKELATRTADDASWVYEVLRQDRFWRYDAGSWYVWNQRLDGRTLADVLAKRRDRQGHLTFVARAAVGYLQVQVPSRRMLLELRDGKILFQQGKQAVSQFSHYSAVIRYTDVGSLLGDRLPEE